MSGTRTVTHVQQAPSPKDGKGAVAGGQGNADAANAAAQARAQTSASMVTERWKKDTRGLFDLTKAPDSTFTPAMFRSLAYALFSDGQKSGMHVDNPAVANEDPQVLVDALSGDEAHQAYAKALVDATRAIAMDRGPITKLGEAVDNLLAGGDVKWNAREVMGHYAILSGDGKKWIAKAPKTAALKAYIETGKCGEHGLLEAKMAINGERDMVVAAQTVGQGAETRKGQCRPLANLLVYGGLGATAPTEVAPADPATAQAQPEDPSIKAADELLARIQKALDKAKKHKHEHDEISLNKKELEKLLADIAKADDKVKDRLYAKPELMQQLAQLDPEQGTKLVGHLNTVQGLYDACREAIGQQYAHAHGGAGTAGAPAYVPPEVFNKIRDYLLARPGKENAETRVRVLRHEQLVSQFITPQLPERRRVLMKLVANGTLEPTVVDTLRDSARGGKGAEAARALMKLGNDSNGELQALKDDHDFRLEIENVNKDVTLPEGFTVNPYHLCLTMWGMQPLANKDAGLQAGERQRQVNPDGIYRPLTIEERMDLQTNLLDPYARRLRSEIAERIVDDDDMKSICRGYETAMEKYIPMFNIMGKAPGPALVEYYDRKYNRDLRGEVNEYVSDGELVECERILGIRIDSSTVGTIAGKSVEHAPLELGPDGKPRIVDLAQSLRQTKDDRGKPLSQVTQDFAETIANDWLFEPSWRPPFQIGGPYPRCSKDELLNRWRAYKKTIEDKRDILAKHTNLKPQQIHPIELLSNAVAEKGGDLAKKIARFFGDGLIFKGSANEILAEMGLRAVDVQARAADAQKELMATDPTKAVEQQAAQTYSEPAAFLFKGLSTLPPSLTAETIAPVVRVFNKWKDEKLKNAPGFGDVNTKSIEERPPRSFAGFYRYEYGVDPETHVARILKSHKDRGADVTHAADAFGVTGLVDQGITTPVGDELVIDDRNRHLVRHDFKVDTAKMIAGELWRAIHEGTRFNVVITKLYTDFSKEEQRLIRMAFRELSGGLDLQFYIQQKLLQKREGAFGAGVTEIGGQGTKEAEKYSKKTELDIGEGDVTKLETYLTAAKTGTVDVHAMMKAAAANRDIDQMFRLADEAEAEDRQKIRDDGALMDSMKLACDQVAWDRIYKTLTNQADLTDRLYSRAHGAYDSWNPFDATDEAGMRNDIKSYVKKLRKQFDREVRAAEDARVKRGEQQREPEAIDQEITKKVKQACQELMANASVRRIIEEELSRDELSDVEGLILNAGETNTKSDVIRAGKDADVIIAGIRNTPPEQRMKLRSDPAYLDNLAQRLPDPNDYRKAIDALMSNRAGDDMLEKVDTAATKKEPREMLRNLVDLDANELKRLQADPELQAKLLAAFEDPEQRRLAREILSTKLREPKEGDDRDAIAEQNRLKFLVANAKQRLRVPLRDKLGWPTMLEQCVAVYRMELEPRLHEQQVGYVRFSLDESAADRKLRDDKALVARLAIWNEVKDEVSAWTKTAEKDKPKKTLSEVWTASDMMRVVRDAVLHKQDPSSEWVKNSLGATVVWQDQYGGEHKTELDDHEEQLKLAIRGASIDLLVNEWSNVKSPKLGGGPSLKQTYEEYAKVKKAAPVDADASRDQALALHEKKMAFVDYTIDISQNFEDLVLPHVGSSDERTKTVDDGKPQLKDRDNKKYNELVDMARERVVNLSKSDNRFLVAKAINLTDKDDFELIDTPNRDAITAHAFRDSKFLRSRGTKAGSGWAADKEAQVVDQRVMQYGHEVSEARTNLEGGTGMITQGEAGKLEERGAEFDRALQAFKDAKAKVAFWLSMIVGVLVTAILTVLTGGLASGPLAALFFTTAIAGCSAGAKALVNEAVLAEDYDLKDEGVKMIGREMLTAFITAGTTMLAQKMVAGVAGATSLGRQARAAEQVLRTPPPAWHGFLREASEEVLSETMSGTVDAALIAIDPVHWMHGVAEGRDRALPLAWKELEATPMRALKGGLTSMLTAGVMSAGKKKELKAAVDKVGPTGRVNLRENFKNVFGENRERVIAVFVEWSVDTLGKGKVPNLDEVPADLVQRFLEEVGEANVEMHTGTAHEKSRARRAQRDLDKAKNQLTKAEQDDFRDMQASAGATDPYITIQEYVRLRHTMAADAVYAWSQKHPGQTLTEAQVKAYIKWCRDAQDAEEFHRRIQTDPTAVDEVKQAKDQPPTPIDGTQTQTQTDDKKKTQTGGKQLGDATTAPTTAAPKEPPVTEVRTVATVEEGYALMRRLAGGEKSALPGEFKHDGGTDAVEWGLGRKSDGSIVVLRGKQGEVDFNAIPGIVALAHTHPAVMDGKPRDLAAVAKNPTGVPINELLQDKNANDLAKFLPSTGDLGYFADNGIASHVVFTPYMHVGEHRVGNPSAQASPAQRIEIVVKNAKLVGRSAIQKHQPAYSAEIIIRTGDGTVLWTGPMFAVRLAADSFKADMPSLSPTGIEQGMLPVARVDHGDEQKTETGSDDIDITKYATPKSQKAKDKAAEDKRNKRDADKGEEKISAGGVTETEQDDKKQDDKKRDDKKQADQTQTKQAGEAPATPAVSDVKIKAMVQGLLARSVPDAKSDSPELRTFKRDLYHLLHALGVHAKSNEVAVAAIAALDVDLASRVLAFLESVPKNSWGVEEFPKTLEDNHPLLTSTDQKATTPDGQDRKAWREAKVNEILSRDGAKPVTEGRPVLYVMGGGGASGKGTLKDMLVGEGTLPDQNVVKIDPDEIKAEIPEYQAIIDEGDSRAAAVVHEESSMLAKEVLAQAYAQKLNILYDVTLGDPVKGRALLERARAMGYEIRLYGVSVDAETAIQRNLSRAKATGRYVPPSEQIKAHKGFSRGFEGYSDLVDEAHLYDTGGAAPTLMAEKEKGGSLEVKNQEMYDRFQAKGDINLQATSVGELTDDPSRQVVKPGVPPSKEQYVEKAMENLAKSSRTAAGTVDTSAGADKAKSMANVSGEQAAETTKGNYAAAIGLLHDNKERDFKDAAELRGFVEDVARSILAGVVKDGELIRKHEAKPELPYTPIAALEGAMNQFYGELLQRLKNPNQDPIALAAWIEYRINLTDHFFADGCGKISSAIAAWVLMRSGHNLPEVTSRGVTFANAPLKIRGTDENADRRQEATWEKHYRRQFNSTSGTTKSGGGGDFVDALSAEPALRNSPNVGNRALRAVDGMDEGSRRQYDDIIDLADNDGQRVLIDRAIAAGHSVAEIAGFAERMRGMSEAEVMKRFTGAGVFQYYEQTCVVASYQIAIADVDPIYAERLRTNPKLVMSEQRDVATSLGGAATKRATMPKAAQGVIDNPEMQRVIDAKSSYQTEGDKGGIESTEMVSTPLHQQLEQVTGSGYEVLTSASMQFDQPGQGMFPSANDAIARINAALDAGMPVIFSALMAPFYAAGHAQVIIEREVTDTGSIYVVRDPMSGSLTRVPQALFGTAYRFQSLTVPTMAAQEAVQTGAVTQTGGPTTAGGTTDPAKDTKKDDAKDARPPSPTSMLAVLQQDPLLSVAGNTPDTLAAKLKDNAAMLKDAARKLLGAKGIQSPTESQLDHTAFKLNEAIKKNKWQTFEAPFDGQAIKTEDNVEQRLGNIFGEKKIFSPTELQADNLKLDASEQQKFQGGHESGMKGAILAASFINSQHRSEGDFSHAYGEDAWKNFQRATSLLDSIPKGQLLQKLDVELLMEVNRLIHTPDTGMKAKLLRFIAMIGRGFKWDKPGELRDGAQFARPDRYSAEEVENLRQAGVEVDVLLNKGEENNLARLKYPEAEAVRPTLDKLIAELKAALAVADADPVAAAADFQRRFVALHPFGDSNGRTSRVVMNRILAEFDMPPAIFADQNRDISMSKQEWRDEVAKGVLRSKQYINKQEFDGKPKDDLLGNVQIRALTKSPDKPIAVDGNSFDLGSDGLLYDPLGRSYIASGNELIPLAQMEHLMFARRIMQNMAYVETPGSQVPSDVKRQIGQHKASEKLKEVTQETRALYDRIAKDPAAAAGITVRNDAQAREADSEYKLAPSPEVGKMLTEMTDLSHLDPTKLMSIDRSAGSPISAALSKYAQTDLEFWHLEKGLRETKQTELADQVRAQRVKLFELAKAQLAKHKDATRVSADNPEGFRFKYEKMMFDRSPLRFATFDDAIKELGDNTITIWRGDYSFARIIGMAPNNDIRQPDAKQIAEKRWDKQQLTNMYDDFARLQGNAVGRQYICTTTDLALLMPGASQFGSLSKTQTVNLSSLPSFLRTRVLAWMAPSYPAGTTDADKAKSRQEALDRGEKIVPTADGGKEIRDAFGIPGTIIKVKVIDKDAGKIEITAERKAFEMKVDKDSLVPGIEAIAGPTFEFEQELHGLETVRPWHVKSTHEADSLKEEFPVQGAGPTPPAT